MYCFSACHVLLLVILYQQTPVVYLQSLTLTLETSPLKCKEEVTLKCLYSGPTCCTEDVRVWTLDGTQIMFNGDATDNSKYKEERNDASLHFDMKILYLEDSDFSKAFQCKYNFLTSNAITLTKDNNTYECPPTKSCPFAYNPATSMIEITGTLNITKAAPSPVLTAYYGKNNLTPDLSITGVINYDTWYYTLTVSTDTGIRCRGHVNDKFKLYAITGTTSTKLCEKDMCECMKCGVYCWLISAIIPLVGVVIMVIVGIVHLIIIYSKPEFVEGLKMCIKLALIFPILTLILNTAFTIPIGIVVCPCNEGAFEFLNILWPFATGLIVTLVLDRLYIKYDWSHLNENHKKKMIAGLFLAGIPLLIIAVLDRESFEGGKKKSTPV